VSDLTDSIEVRILYRTTKAWFVEFRDGHHAYLPHSITEKIDESIPEFQVITAAYWWVKKNE